MKSTEPLVRNREFRHIYTKGKSKANGYLVLYFVRARDQKNHLGITVSKKLGNAVKRNRAKRLIREAYRHIEPLLKGGYSIVLVSRSKTVKSGLFEVKNSMLELFKSQGLLKE